MTPPKTAETSVPVHPLLAQRWSPRGLDATHALDERAVQALLEAARWAPSANNSQPWRFLVGRRGDDTFTRLLGVLAPGNRSWAHAASALVLVAAQTVDDAGRPRPWALFDAGQAVAVLSVQAEADGLSVHQMDGFDTDAARHEFGLDAELTPLVVLAVGRHDPHAKLPDPLAARERASRSREPLEALLLAAPGAASRAA
ncbi:nitroreductase family protein [Geodermatophilus sp. CPCC 205506]|uniref:nitroreductase family protein n=1 Tax=Geodermatophilus sp. CPCC 205506 TaxID=2936596 RepID=UPI003EEEE7B6